MINVLIEKLGQLFNEVPNKIKPVGVTRWGKNNKYFMAINRRWAIAIDFSTGEKHKINFGTEENTNEEFNEYLRGLDEMDITRVDWIKQRWSQLPPFGEPESCSYFKDKGVYEPYGVKYMHDEVYVPYFSFKHGMCAIQRINSKGKKMFVTNSITTRAFAVVDKVKIPEKKYICIVEGVASAISATECLTGILDNFCVVASGSSGNIPFLYNDLKNRYLDKVIFGIADDDEASRRAFRGSGCKYIKMNSKDISMSGWDINDDMQYDRKQAINFIRRELYEQHIK